MMPSETLPQAGETPWALFLDIDGTLIDLAASPSAVVVPRSLPALLDSLATKVGGALALVSGRSLDAIDHLFPDLRDAAGCHGAEWRLGGKIVTSGQSWADDFVAGIEAAAGRLDGVLVERKSRSLAIHYRAAPEHEQAVRAVAEAAIQGVSPPLCLLEGKSVIEIIPAGTSKGAAIERFMSVPPYAGRVPVFAGDDVTDESGFAAVNRLGGLSIRIGFGPVTEARFRFPDTEALRHWLEGVNAAMGRRSQS